jgi:hypothetical protein
MNKQVRLSDENIQKLKEINIDLNLAVSMLFQSVLNKPQNNTQITQDVLKEIDRKITLLKIQIEDKYDPLIEQLQNYLKRR